MQINKIYNEDCFVTMQRMIDDNVKANIVLTSPPYNTGRNSFSENKTERMKNHETRYDIYLENKTVEEYTNWTVDIFNSYDKVLAENGVILYNMSYGNENAEQLWLTIAEIIKRTNFTVADCIVWKKKSALPNNVSSNKLTRICEYVFVICRKSEYKTFQCNKKVKSFSKTGQKYYENIYNFVEAKNNDGANNLNKATFSSELCVKLLDMYSRSDDIVYDSFMGTGTTAVACLTFDDLSYIGSELSAEQCEFAKDRISQMR